MANVPDLATCNGHPQRRNLSRLNFKVVRNSDTQITIIVPQFASYQLPPASREIVALDSLPPALINGETAISLAQA